MAWWCTGTKPVPVKLKRRGATMTDKTKKDRFLYTPESVDHWVTDMADVLSKSGLHWHSMAYFMERSEPYRLQGVGTVG